MERLDFVTQDKEFFRNYHLREMALSDITTITNTAIEKKQIEIAKKSRPSGRLFFTHAIFSLEAECKLDRNL